MISDFGNNIKVVHSYEFFPPSIFFFQLGGQVVVLAVDGFVVDFGTGRHFGLEGGFFFFQFEDFGFQGLKFFLFFPGSLAGNS